MAGDRLQQAIVQAQQCARANECYLDNRQLYLSCPHVTTNPGMADHFFLRCAAGENNYAPTDDSISRIRYCCVLPAA